MLVLFAIIVLMVVLSSTVFSLQKVQLSFLEIPNTLSMSDASSILETADFDYGTSVFLIDKAKYIDNLEKNNPKLKVIGIETRFPNELVVQVVEREEFCIIERINDYLVCDSDLKVLRIVDDISLIDLPLVENLGIDTSYLELGDFASVCVNTYVFKNIEDAFWECYYERANVINLVKKFVFKEDGTLSIVTNFNFRIEIQYPTRDLSQKISCGLQSVFSDEGVGEDFVGLVKVIESNDSIVVYTIPNG